MASLTTFCNDFTLFLMINAINIENDKLRFRVKHLSELRWFSINDVLVICFLLSFIALLFLDITTIKYGYYP